MRPLNWNSCVNCSCFDVSQVKVPGSGVPSESRPNELSKSRYAVVDLKCRSSEMSQSRSTCRPVCLSSLPVRRDAPGQRVLAEAVVARVLVRRLETPVELPAGAEHRDRDVVVPVVDRARDAGRHAGVGAQLHGVLVGRALLVAVGQVGDDIDLDGIRREKAQPRRGPTARPRCRSGRRRSRARRWCRARCRAVRRRSRGGYSRRTRSTRDSAGRARRPAARRRSCPRRCRDRPSRASPLR